MTGRRRHRKHNKLNLTDNTNFTGDSSQTGDSMPSINFPKSPSIIFIFNYLRFFHNFKIILLKFLEKKTFQNYENPDQIVTYDEYQNQIDQEDENSDDFFDYDDDFTEDTVSTEDTEDNSTNYNEYGSSNFKQIRPIVRYNLNLSKLKIKKIIALLLYLKRSIRECLKPELVEIRKFNLTNQVETIIITIMVIIINEQLIVNTHIQIRKDLTVTL